MAAFSSAHPRLQYDVDAQRLCISGFSDGASYALTLGAANGALFSHIAGGWCGDPPSSGRAAVKPNRAPHVLLPSCWPRTLTRRHGTQPCGLPLVVTGSCAPAALAPRLHAAAQLRRCVTLGQGRAGAHRRLRRSKRTQHASLLVLQHPCPAPRQARAGLAWKQGRGGRTPPTCTPPACGPPRTACTALPFLTPATRQAAGAHVASAEPPAPPAPCLPRRLPESTPQGCNPSFSLPRRWAHYTESLDFSISVTCRFAGVGAE